MRKAFDLGCTFYDTAQSYAAGDNERLVGRALAPIRDQVVIATKFRVDDSAPGAEVGRQIRGRLEESLTRLGTEHVELLYQHRVSPSVPVEDAAAVMSELIAEGKIGGWGQSQATVEQIRWAHAVTPITAIQSEYSIMVTRSPTQTGRFHIGLGLTSTTPQRTSASVPRSLHGISIAVWFGPTRSAMPKPPSRVHRLG